MAKNIETIAEKLGAILIESVPDTGGGAFGSVRLGQIVSELRARLRPSQGERPGRPSDANWTLSPKIPMSEATHQQLKKLAEQASDEERKITPMQLAAHLLEQALQDHDRPSA